jgi:hypothetical protein
MADKGIRSGVMFEFKRMLAQRVAMGNTAFRKHIIFWAVENYGCTVAAACTHYNHALQDAKKTMPDAVVGLGRPPEKNNGGRKRKVAVDSKVVPVNSILQNFLNALPRSVKAVEQVETPEGVDEAPAEESTEQTVFRVCKKSDGTVIADGLTFEAARALVDKAAAAKKAKLYWV